MARIQTNYQSLQNAFEHCSEELLRHKSRYYPYAERFLAELADRPDFSLTAYDAKRLSPPQRLVLTGLLRERPSVAVGRSIIQIVESVIRGRPEVDEALLNKYRSFGTVSPVLPTRALSRLDKTLDESASPAGLLLNMASRLGIPVEVKGREVRVPMRVLARHLDSPNPTVRQNLQDSILLLREGGYRLINDRRRPLRQIDWDQQQKRPSASVVVWRMLMRWTHLQKRHAPEVYSRSA